MPRETDITHIAGTEVLTATAGVLPVSLSSDIQIGAVELKNATTDDRAKIAATGSVAEGDNALAVQAPVLGVTTGAAVTTDAAGTHQQYLRGLVVDLVALLARVPVLGPALAAAATPITLATDDAHLGAVGAAADVDGVLHGQLRYVGEAVDNIPVQGKALAAASMPVTLASDEPAWRINAKANVPVQIAIAGAASTQSAALPVGTYIVTSNLDVAIRVAAAPTALVTDDPVWAYSTRRVVIATASDKVAAIRLLAVTGTVWLTLEG